MELPPEYNKDLSYFGMKPEALLTTEMSNKKYKWYSFPNVVSNLVSCVEKREVALMSHNYKEYSIRLLTLRNVEENRYFWYMAKFYNFFKRDYNMYISNAKFLFIPFFDMNLKKRSLLTREWFRNNTKSPIDYDILLDFDSKGDFMGMKKEVYAILKLLNKYAITYWIIPSGRNFQINIPTFSYLNMEEVKEITANFKTNFELEHLDLIGCGAFNKLKKCPYAWINEIICYPLDKTLIDSFMEWNYGKIFDSNYIINNIGLGKDRGLQLQNFAEIPISVLNLNTFLDKWRLRNVKQEV